MRAPLAAVVLCLALAGLSFSGETRFTIHIRDFANNQRMPQRVFGVKQYDSIKFKVLGMEAYQASTNSKYYYFQKQHLISGTQYGPSTQMKQELDEVLEKGCPKDNYTNVNLMPIDLKNFSAYAAGAVGYERTGLLISEAGETVLNQNYITISMANQSGCNDYPNYSGTQRLWIRYRVQTQSDSDACSVPTPSSCMQCAWPFQAIPDTSGCGCKVNVTAYQSQANLKFQCNAYCNSTPINGHQAYTDWTRSNFDASKGTITCACSDRQTVVYRPTSTCPAGSNPEEDAISDTGLQKVEYDPTTNPNLRDTSSSNGGGSGGGTGQYDSSSNEYLRRIDSILGNITDTTGVSDMIDSLQGKGKYDSAIGHDTSAIKIKIGDIKGDTTSANTQGWFNGSPKTWRGMDCWQCDTIPDTSIVFDFHVFGTEVKDTLAIGISPIMTGLGFDFWPWLRALEWLCIVIVMTPICINIAGGTTGKDSV